MNSFASQVYIILQQHKGIKQATKFNHFTSKVKLIMVLTLVSVVNCELVAFGSRRDNQSLGSLFYVTTSRKGAVSVKLLGVT